MVFILALRNGFQLVPESVQWQAVVKHGRWHSVPCCGPIKSRTLLTSCCLHFCRLEMWTTLDTVTNASSCRCTGSNATRVHFYSRKAVLKITHCFTASQWQLWRTDKTWCDWQQAQQPDKLQYFAHNWETVYIRLMSTQNTGWQAETEAQLQSHQFRIFNSKYNDCWLPMNDDDVTEWMEPLFRICISFATKSRGSLDEFGNMSSRISWTTCTVTKNRGNHLN